MPKISGNTTRIRDQDKVLSRIGEIVVRLMKYLIIQRNGSIVNTMSGEILTKKRINRILAIQLFGEV